MGEQSGKPCIEVGEHIWRWGSCWWYDENEVTATCNEVDMLDEIVRLRNGVDALTNLFDDQCEIGRRYARAVNKAEAEVERLRAEVERIEGQRKLRADMAYLFKAERDDERRLADQLAAALFAVKHDRPSVHSDRVWATLNDALEAYDEARRER